MIIPEDTLKAETLNRVIEEFVLREGTDYGLREFSLEQKVKHVKSQLSKKDAFIVFDSVTETVSIVEKSHLPAELCH